MESNVWFSQDVIELDKPGTHVAMEEQTLDEGRVREKVYRYRFWRWTFWFIHDAECWKRLLMLILAILGKPQLFVTLFNFA